MFDWRKIAVKAAVTFVEALLAALVVTPITDINERALLVALAGAIGAVLSFAYNITKQYLDSLG